MVVISPADADHRAACWRHTDPAFDQEWERLIGDALKDL